VSGHRLRLATLALLAVALGGCRGCVSNRPPIHLNPNMDYQPKVQAQEDSEFFADGGGMRHPVPGTVALEDPVELDAFVTGKDAGGAPVASVPAAARERFGGEEAFAARGLERYEIYCAPCHGSAGDGQGMLRRRSGVASADLRLARLRQAPDGHLYDVIANGLGLMPSYAAQVPVADRWAIVAHVRALQAASPVTGDAAAPDAAADAVDAAGGEAPADAPPAAEPAAEEGR
jgi:mono/diheme cytochrome c family protein